MEALLVPRSSRDDAIGSIVDDDLPPQAVKMTLVTVSKKANCRTNAKVLLWLLKLWHRAIALGKPSPISTKDARVSLSPITAACRIVETTRGGSMMRKYSFPFVVTIGVGLCVVACGRQVTPNPPGLGPGGAPPGYLALVFDVGAPFNFSSDQYMFVFNTTGNGVTPSTDTVQTNWAGYSFAFVALGNGGATQAQAVQLVRATNGKGPPHWLPLPTTPQQFSYEPNSNGTGTEFTMLLQHTVLSGFPSASPGPSPTPTPPNVIKFNAFVTQTGPSRGLWTFVDSLGFGGPTDPQFVSPALCLSEPFQVTKYGQFQAPNQAEQIVSVEIANNPASPSPCP